MGDTIYVLHYALDVCDCGTMEESIHLFSSLDKLYQYAEKRYNKKREDFKDGYCYEKCSGGWDTERWRIEEMKVDEDLQDFL